MALLPSVDGLAWDHNAYYHRLILSRLPAQAQRVLDVGCGAGALAMRLARRVPHVDAVDRDATMVERARLALPRVELPRDLPIEIAAAGAQAFAAVSLKLAHLAGVTALTKDDDGMPVACPELTTREVREQARALLPGSRVGRLLFWRYLLEWDRPNIGSTFAPRPSGVSDRIEQRPRGRS